MQSMNRTAGSFIEHPYVRSNSTTKTSINSKVFKSSYQDRERQREIDR